MGGWDWLFGSNKTVDLSQDWLKGFNAQNGFADGNRDLNAQRSNAFYKQLTSGGNMDPSSWYARAMGIGGMQNNAMNGAMQMANRSAGDVWGDFARGALPGMQGAAQAAAVGATSRGEQSMLDLARMRSAEARNAAELMASRTGLGTMGSSGAATAAIAKAMQAPLLEAEAGINQQYGNAYMGALNPLMGYGYQREASRGDDYLKALSGINQAQGNYLQAGGGLSQLLGEQSQQYLLAPMLQQVQQQGLLQKLGDAALYGLGGALGGGLGTLGVDFIKGLASKGAQGMSPMPQFDAFQNGPMGNDWLRGQVFQNANPYGFSQSPWDFSQMSAYQS